MKLSAAIIAYNEEKNIEKCLQSLTFADEIVVIDSGSTDRTVELASKYTDKIFKREFDDFSSQKNFAVSQCGGYWIFSIDADEWVSPELAREIQKTLRGPQTNAAFRVHRKTNLFGREFSFSGLQQDKPVRLFIKSKARFVKPVHEELEIQGSTGEFKNVLYHKSFQTAREHMRRLQVYTELESAPAGPDGHYFGKFMGRSLGRFASIYFLKQGFRDGVEGFIYAVLSGYYEFVRCAKSWEKLSKKGNV